MESAVRVGVLGEAVDGLHRRLPPLLSGARRSAIWIKGPSTPGKAAIAGWIQCVEEAQIIRGNPRSLPHMRDESPHTPSGHAVLRDVFSIVTEI